MARSKTKHKIQRHRLNVKRKRRLQRRKQAKAENG